MALTTGKLFRYNSRGKKPEKTLNFSACSLINSFGMNMNFSRFENENRADFDRAKVAQFTSHIVVLMRQLLLLPLYCFTFVECVYCRFFFRVHGLSLNFNVDVKVICMTTQFAAPSTKLKRICIDKSEINS